MICKKGIPLWNWKCLAKISYFDSFILNVFLFVTAIILLLVMILFISILCKHTKLTSLVASLALQQIKEVGAVATHRTSQYIECTCKLLWYPILMLSLSILGLVIFIIIKSSKIKTV